MYSTEQKSWAAFFQSLHQQPQLFLLPNVWNVGSAYVFAKQGFQAVATSSAGIAYDLGYPDCEDITFADLLEMVGKITRRIDVPLSVDFERGYGETFDSVKENARQLLQAGAVGFNLEDGEAGGGLSSLALQQEKLAALVELKRETGVDFVINARTCAYWLNVGEEAERADIAIERGNAFRQFGADCVFVPGVIPLETVALLTQKINAPINIILNKQFGSPAQLEQLGVRRLSVGSAPVRHIYAEIIQTANALKQGEFEALLNTPFSYAEANAYFGQKA
ncbi:isocitrate lyase/PEP mutase family protein [Necropsobacter massiliensis]|uniref:isocitrate lyase/PEP mutase family protein n=1 Tax=Necropsobacter massiliensis TaxID=1400001 RepID=UPI000595AE4F|nr:isocitrate lyase/phosphoenolpyruvate mutase family protein [Necropsobacter massiliensis]